MKHRTHARYGWLRDLPDARDHLYAAPYYPPKGLPPSVDLRPQCPPVYDQGKLGSCTANAIGAAVQFEWRKQHLADEVPSRLFIYYAERQVEGTVDSDSGAQLRDGIQVVSEYGAPFESAWPYDISQFAVKPPAAVWSAGLQERAAQYSRVTQLLTQMKGCLAEGYPFAFGFSVYESFESDAVAVTGVVPMPSQDEQLLGGHAVMAVGYDDATQRFIVRNSWGPTWGDGGYFHLPYAYLGDPMMAADLWTIRLMQT